MKILCFKGRQLCRPVAIVWFFIALVGGSFDAAQAQLPEVYPKNIVAHSEIYDVSASIKFNTEHMSMNDAIEATKSEISQFNCRVEGGISGPQEISRPVIFGRYLFKIALDDSFRFGLSAYEWNLLKDPIDKLTYDVVEVRQNLRVLLEPNADG